MSKLAMIVVRAILENPAGKILFLKRASETARNQWCLPGGKVEQESLEESCSIEVKEETDLDLNQPKILFYRDNPPESNTHVIDFFLTGRYSGTLKLNHESSKARWFVPLEFPHYDIAFGHDKAVLKYLLEYRE